MAVVSYLIAPTSAAAALRSRSRLRGRFPGFLPHRGGRERQPVRSGEYGRDPQQRRRVLPADARRHRARANPSRSRPTSTGPARSAASSPRRSAERGRAGVPVKILLDAVGSATIGAEILKMLDAGGCQVAWYNPIRWYTLGRFNNRTHRKSLIVDGRVAFTGGAGIADHWRGNAQDPDDWRDMQIRLEGPAVVPLQTGFAHNWQQTTGELLIGRRVLSRAIEPRGRLAVQTLLSSPETGASSVRTMYYLSIVCARRVDLHRQSVLRARPGGHRHADRGQAARRRRPHHGVGNPQRQLAGAAQQRPAVRPAARGRHRDPRVQPHDAAPQDDGRRRPVGRRSARPTSTTDRSRTTRRATSASSTTRWRRTCIGAFEPTSPDASASSTSAGSGAARGHARRSSSRPFFRSRHDRSGVARTDPRRRSRGFGGRPFAAWHGRCPPANTRLQVRQHHRAPKAPDL